MNRRCPMCDGPIARVRCTSPRTAHFICTICRQICCGENGVLVICARPAEHVFNVYRVPTTSPVRIGAFVPESVSRGLL